MIKNLVSDELVNMLGKSVYLGYSLARNVKFTHELFDTPIGKETLPYIRRAGIDFTVYRNAKLINNLNAEFRPNKSGNSHHIELRYNDKIIITINHLAHINGIKQGIPREAKFRELLSINNPAQGNLFDLPNKDFGNGRIHTILVHSGNEFPEEIALIVVNPECTKILDALPINLTAQDKSSDVNVIDALTPEFIKFAKENFKG